MAERKALPLATTGAAVLKMLFTKKCRCPVSESLNLWATACSRGLNTLPLHPFFWEIWEERSKNFFVFKQGVKAWKRLRSPELVFLESN